MLSNRGRSRKISFRMAGLARTIVCIALVCIAFTRFAYTMDREKYSSKYDDIDVDEILANPRLRNQYVGCIISAAPCVTGSARFLKDQFAEAFVTNCKRCTEKQVIFLDKITEWFTTNDPETWERAVRIAIQKIQSRNK